GGRPRHPQGGRRGRPARDARRRDGHGGAPGVRAGSTAARGARREHHLRSLQRLLRPAEPSRDVGHVPVDGDRLGHDLGDHESAAPGGRAGRDGGRRADGPRPRLLGVDPAIPPAGGRRGARARGPPPRGACRASRRARAVSAEDVLVVFTPSGRRGRFPAGTSVLDAARGLGVDSDAVCGGRAICGRCQVQVSAGEHAKLGIDSRADHLTPAGPSELEYARASGMREGRRLACTAGLAGDVVLDVPPESQVHRQVVRKEAEVRQIELDPVVRLYYVEVREPVLERPSGDLRRLKEVLEREWGLAGLDVDPEALRALPGALREGRWAVTVAVHDQQTITAVWPGYHDRSLGVAFDVGSTTVAGHLCDLSSGEVLASAGAMNPQIRFGEDLMSRVSYVMLNPGSQVELTKAVRECLRKLVGELVAAARARRTDVLEVTVVGNPIMHHLLLGIDPTPL